MHQSYLKLIQNKIQDLAELVEGTLSIDVTVVDDRLRRIAGTGDFSRRINRYSPKNSIFAEVINTGVPAVNLDKNRNKTCLNCPDFTACVEKKNITYPIRRLNKTIGVVSLACFSEDQILAITDKEEECISLLKHMVSVIENDVDGIEHHNKIEKRLVEINEIINCIDKGIVIIGTGKEILHINSAALRNLGLSVADEAIIDTPLSTLVEGVDLEVTENTESYAYWKVKNRKYKVLYKANRIILDRDKQFTILTFDTIDEMLHRVATYNNRHVVTFDSIVGRSEKFKKTVRHAQVAANSDSTVLLYGESGTGKELFARSIHNESYRRNGPFVVINCAGMPDTLIESELFGYVKGAFTGALPKGKQGKFEAAQGGTIFMDEISEIPLNLQAKLLRVLQERTVDRIGSVSPVELNVRVIAATNDNIAELVREGRFRLDLYYRLNIIPITLPALRERIDDIEILSEYILERTLQRMHRSRLTVNDDAMEVLRSYHWPGNIRELENVIEYAVNFCRGSTVGKTHLPEYLFSRDTIIPSDLMVEQGNSIKETMAAAEKKMILNYMERYGDSTECKKRIARDLDISLATLYRKISAGSRESSSQRG